MTAQTVFEWLGTAYGFFLGACLASFGCVVSERVPAGRSIRGRSQCVCGRQLRVSENIPVAGWLRGRGRAGCCGAALPARYLLWEVGLGGVGAGAVGAAWRAWVAGSLTVTGVLAAATAVAAAFVVLLVVTWQRQPRP